MPANITIQQESPTAPDATALIEELDGVLAPHYPTESRHGYSVQKLIDQGVHFFVARVNGRPAGCGGVQFFLDPEPPFAELKRMFVRPDFRGQGVAKVVLRHLEQVVQEKGIELLRLETGIYQDAAISLYESFGYRQIPPFEPYFPDPLSRCYEKKLSPLNPMGRGIDQFDVYF